MIGLIKTQLKIRGKYMDYRRFRNYVMSFSYQERRRKKLERFNQELGRFREMNEDKLNFEYIELKTEIEHKKNVLSLFIILIALAVLMNVWSKMFSFLKMVLEYAATTGNDSEQIIMVSFVISILIVIVLTIVVLFILFDLSKEIMIMKRRLMLIEYVQQKKNDDVANE